MPGRDRSSSDWFCKSCKGKDGLAFKNFGHRTECRLCGLSKGVCFGSKVEQAGSPTTSVRQRAKPTDSGEAVLRVELARVQKERQEMAREFKAFREAKPQAGASAGLGGSHSGA